MTNENEKKINLSKALVAFQSELKPINKDATNPFFKSTYATLANIMETIQPLLAKHKIAIIQMMTQLDTLPALRTAIVHESGESIEDITPLYITKQDPQSHGSAVTYARRYALCSALGIVADEDDDGNKASEVTKTNTVTTAQKIFGVCPTHNKQLIQGQYGAYCSTKLPTGKFCKGKQVVVEEPSLPEYEEVPF